MATEPKKLYNSEHGFSQDFKKCLSKTAIPKISAYLDLATELCKTCIPTTFKSILSQKGQFTLQSCPRRWFVEKYLVINLKKSKVKFFIVIFACRKRRFSGNYLFKRQVRRVLAESLIVSRIGNSFRLVNGG